MRNAEVIPIRAQAIDVAQLAADIKSELAALNKDERTEHTARDSAARRRLEVGRMLAKARPMWPERGPKAKGWGEFLEKCGLPQQTASDYMRLAGWISPTAGETASDDVPTYRDAGIDKRPRKAEVEEPAPRRKRVDLPGAEYAPGTAKRTRPTLEILAEIDDVLDEAIAAWPSNQSLKPAVDLLEKKLREFKSMHGMRRE